MAGVRTLLVRGRHAMQGEGYGEYSLGGPPCNSSIRRT